MIWTNFVGLVPNAAYQAPRSLAFLFRRRSFFKGFYHIWAWQSSWSCDLYHLNKFAFPQSHWGSIWNLALTDWVVSSEEMFEKCGRRTAEGRRKDVCLYYRLTCEPSARWANKKGKHLNPLNGTFYNHYLYIICIIVEPVCNNFTFLPRTCYIINASGTR